MYDQNYFEKNCSIKTQINKILNKILIYFDLRFNIYNFKKQSKVKLMRS